MFIDSTEIPERIFKRISERTGLKTDEEIHAYILFCHHSDWDNNVFIYDEAEQEFYLDSLKNASLGMKTLEGAYLETIENFGSLMALEVTAKSPLFKKAKKEYGDYYRKFVEMKLISLPQKGDQGYGVEYYPKLIGYNFFNDPEFYKVEGCNRILII